MTPADTNREAAPRPAKVEVGQRWKSLDSGNIWVVASVAEHHIGMRREKDGLESSAGDCWFTDGDSVYLGGPTPIKAPEPVEGVMGANSDGDPVACLACGNPALNCLHFCAKCSPSGVEYTAEEERMMRAWRAGDRSFLRSRQQPAAGTGSSLARTPGAPGRASGPAPGAGANPSRDTPVKAGGGALTKREVGAGPNGPWLPYDSLVDSDPFTSYRHRRENGAVVGLEVAPAVNVVGCYTSDKQVEYGTEKTIAEAMQGRPANPVTAPASPISATPGSTIPQTRAYRTPSGESGSACPFCGEFFPTTAHLIRCWKARPRSHRPGGGA